jgi:hypothetical protein
MCMNCGCGEVDERHKATDITAEDIRQAAAGKPMQETIQNMRTSLDQMEMSGGQMTGSQMSSSQDSSNREGQFSR